MSGANQCPSLKRRRSWALNAPMIVERFIAIAPTLTTSRSIQAASQPNLPLQFSPLRSSPLEHQFLNSEINYPAERHSCYQTSEL